MPELESGAVRPALRPLEAHRVTQPQPGLVLIDPLGLAGDPTFVPEGLLPLVQLFDGARTVAEIEALFAQHGQVLPPDFVANVVQQFEERLLLASNAFASRVADAARAFQAAGVRPARLPGSAGYPPEVPALRAALRAIVPPATAGGAVVRGLIAPHIDLERGSAGYGRSYARLAASEPADLYVIFGTGHKGPLAPVTGLPLDWETPLGVVPTDRAFVAAVHARLGQPNPTDLLLHRDEHSIEFQVLFLKHLLGDRPFQVAGFLTGALHSECGDPGHEGYVDELLGVFRAAAAASGKRVCWIGGADLAHVGPYFGDPRPVDAERLERLRAEEHERLRPLLAGNPGGFHQAHHEAGNPDRVCGLTPIYLTAALAGGAGELLHYGQAAATDGSQVVSFCSVAFA
jgi:AmmeMemoRadiSam system protein B